jgi:hypothetical protein
MRFTLHAYSADSSNPDATNLVMHTSGVLVDFRLLYAAMY